MGRVQSFEFKMFANFHSNCDIHEELLVKALSSIENDDNYFTLIPKDGQSLEISHSLRLFSPYLSDIINSRYMVNEVPTLIIPDCSSTSIRHLLKILTKGFTKVQVSPDAVEHVKGIIEAAEVFNIDIKNLIFDEREESNDKLMHIKSEKEDGEIDEDTEEYQSKTSDILDPKTIPFMEENVEKVNSKGINENIKFEFLELEETVIENTGFSDFQSFSFIQKQGEAANKPLIKVASFANIESSVSNLVSNNENRELPYKCADCNKSFAKKAGLITHQNTTSKHGRMPILKCIECEALLGGQEELNNHRLAVHKSKFDCELCGKVFLRMKGLVEHIFVHNGETPYTCDMCSYASAKKKGVKNHMKTHHNVDVQSILLKKLGTSYTCEIFRCS